MQITKINWTDRTWGPASGCDKITPECDHCYAFTLAERRRGTPAFPHGFDVMVRPWKLNEPFHVEVPSLIFTNSMTDMFHPSITDEYRDACFEVMRRADWHRYQVLTKRPKTAVQYFRTRRVPDSVWLGVTVGVRDTLSRIDALRDVDVAVRFLSCEPVLEQLEGIDLDGIAWCISGGESGDHLSDLTTCERRALVRRGSPDEARWMLRDDRAPWLRHLRDACADRGVAYWHKQHGGPRPESGGRVLDGVTHDAMPRHIPGAMPSGTRPDDWKSRRLAVPRDRHDSRPFALAVIC